MTLVQVDQILDRGDASAPPRTVVNQKNLGQRGLKYTQKNLEYLIHYMYLISDTFCRI